MYYIFRLSTFKSFKVVTVSTTGKVFFQNKDVLVVENIESSVTSLFLYFYVGFRLIEGGDMVVLRIECCFL